MENEEPQVSEIRLLGSLRQAYNLDYKLVYIYSPPTELENNTSLRISSLSQQSASLPPIPAIVYPGIEVDQKTTFTAFLSSFNSVPPSSQQSTTMPSSASPIRICQQAITQTPSSSLIALALQSGVWSRFRIDTNIPRGVFEKMFTAWITNSVNHSLADDVFIARDINTNEDIGMITLKLVGDVTHIGLLAVQENRRKQGIAKMLLTRAVLWANEHCHWNSAASLSVVTQGSNTAATSVYSRFGFHISKVQHIYHAWLPQHLQEPHQRADHAIIPFCKQYLTGQEGDFVNQVLQAGLDSAARFTTMCATYVKDSLGSSCERVVMVPSGTAALEMAALLCEITVGDEILMPSFTFASTANAFVLRGGIPVFVDICKNTLNINPMLLEAAITSRTRAICCVHYAGVPCEMDTICAIAKKYNLFVIEDAAQGLLSVWCFGYFGVCCCCCWCCCYFCWFLFFHFMFFSCCLMDIFLVFLFWFPLFLSNLLLSFFCFCFFSS